MFMRSAKTFVPDALRGLIASTDDIAWNPDPGYLTRAQPLPKGQVAIVSGGGSGHEPMHAGFLGAGMLTAVCPGLVFTSPNALQIHEACKAVDAGGGVLHIVKNYTGDVMNFGIARELLREDNIDTDVVLVEDDVATERADGDGPGRRGTAATVVVEKVCGAAAERGESLAEVVRIGRLVAQSARSMAVALAPCTLPGATEPSFDLPAGQMELGIGIHGERGRERIDALPAPELVRRLTDPIIDSLELAEGDRVIALVNGLGATHPLELQLLFAELGEYLGEKGIHIERPLVGTFVTAMNMAGASITLVRVDDQILELWDAPSAAPAWPNSPARSYSAVGPRESFGPSYTAPTTPTSDGNIGAWVADWAQKVLDEEPALTDLDRRAGDGDFGTNMVAALEQLDLTEMRNTYSASTTFDAISQAYLGHAGGTSGALFGIWFRHFFRVAREGTLDLATIAAAARAGLDNITALGGARPGDKTMVDAIAPAVDALEEGVRLDGVRADVLQRTSEAARAGAESTEVMVASRGRASYVGEAARGVVDPGALVIAWFFECAVGH
ncbi:UNVERIFIED_ORG: homodimeric dihydroxyacetone kinase [Nocardia globerula]|uniref:Homodimeric dihydroxyacetone kinase n=1 Tax=Nocardia globerula TaxID=1818 RepID=A0A652YRJ5_NOCGL|nr:dihydroxyacetone kinase family protein [Rhodococcus globerulus]NMD63332.1 dihydroxyacetone kinase family protein [Nocardia globerula]PVX62897.1 homodimeric dihydroxyacetone kinase [Rhodococcus globerulus]